MNTLSNTERRFRRMMGNPTGVATLNRMALKVAARMEIPYEDAIGMVTQVFKAFSEEYLANGTIRLPYGLLIKPTSKVRESIKKRIRCIDPGVIPDKALEIDPPYSLFHDLTVTAMMALNIEDELRQEGISLRTLAHACITR